MASNTPAVSQQASNFAAGWTRSTSSSSGVTAFFAILVVVLVVVFAIKFRRRHEDEVGAPVHGALVLELTWTVIPLIIAMGMFVWGASVFFAMATPPSNAMEIYAVGKRWMWKFQHVTGQREINELHIPVGPARQAAHRVGGRHPQRLLPGVPREDGRGAGPDDDDVVHGHQAGPLPPVLRRVLRHEALRHDRLGHRDGARRLPDLAGGRARRPPNMVEAGEKLFTDLACATCHRDDASGPRAFAQGVFGSTVRLQGGATVVADENYLRESIVNPQAKIVEGYPAAHADVPGARDRGAAMQLIAYVKSLSSAQEGASARPPGRRARRPPRRRRRRTRVSHDARAGNALETAH